MWDREEHTATALSSRWMPVCLWLSSALHYYKGRFPATPLVYEEGEPRAWRTKIVQGWPKLWANVRAVIGISVKVLGQASQFWPTPYNFCLSLERGSAPVRDVRVRLRGVSASEPTEGDCTAGACQCGAGTIGRDLKLPRVARGNW